MGSTYDVQIFMPYWDANWATIFSDGTNATSPLNVGSPDTWAGPGAAVPQYVIGTFTADASTETIYLGNSLPGTVFTAMLVRDESQVPEPATLILLTPTLLALVRLRRRKTTRG